jgi:hypothetical protein
VIDSLHALPALRDALLCENRVLNLTRQSNVEANLAQRVGAVNTTSCAHCTRGLGPFLLCVLVVDHLGRSCANCHYNNKGTRYSLRKFPAHNSVF